MTALPANESLAGGPRERDRSTTMIAAELRSGPNESSIPSTAWNPGMAPAEWEATARPAGSRSSGVDDTLLVRNAQQGDTDAFERLVRHYDRPVLRLAMHLTGSVEDAQDIYQEAFLRAYLNLSAFRFECSFFTWLYRIVANLCLDHLRKRNSRGRDLTVVVSRNGEAQSIMEYVADERSGSSPERSVLGTELRGHIKTALGELSPRERMVFELRHYHGMKLRTVAGMLNTTEGTIKNTLFRATHKLRTVLAEVR
jgi:RNA polymerase sigma-70 factor, ECF subfamily